MDIAASDGAKEIDAYLATLTPEAHATLAEVRRMVRAAAPGAVESVSYRMPTFKYQGRPLIYFGAARNHCALYGIPAAIHELADALAAYDTSKGTIRFPIGEPPPETLVRALVAARIAEIETAAASRGRKRGSSQPGV